MKSWQKHNLESQVRLNCTWKTVNFRLKMGSTIRQHRPQNVWFMTWISFREEKNLLHLWPFSIRLQCARNLHFWYWMNLMLTLTQIMHLSSWNYWELLQKVFLVDNSDKMIQIILVTHKPSMFENCDSLVGVCRPKDQFSKVFSHKIKWLVWEFYLFIVNMIFCHDFAYN